jgi:hypothetical protein
MSEVTDCCSVGRLEFVLPHRVVAIELGIYRHLFHSPDGLHPGCCFIFFSRRWSRG